MRNTPHHGALARPISGHRRGRACDPRRDGGPGTSLRTAGDTIGDVKLAVSEAATNAIQHAYPSGTTGTVAATAWTEAAQLRITISDEGTGMVPRSDSPGLGLGLPIGFGSTSPNRTGCRGAP